MGRMSALVLLREPRWAGKGGRAAIQWLRAALEAEFPKGIGDFGKEVLFACFWPHFEDFGALEGLLPGFAHSGERNATIGCVG